MKDITTREDILIIMRKFYDKLLADTTINFFFTKVTTVDQHLEDHFETLTTFWEQSLFLKGGYSNNMLQIHKNIHEKHSLSKEHFEIWLNHLYSTIDTLFKGKIAEQMKTNALSMSTVMQIKFQ
ncbi:group III truncated hemoglobin [Flavobacterium jejuense]|uniref:Group III truncated hemoglobin n=1 Tax=Flavobacterium jejuense TaxID=1544455 RepID=A0ABX0IWK5_9FLAO|nr:group III truncated hemoglobin [Flavobacterium jejuense]NHN27199.1 group III truncated hemoglobin [Flavobacterium jejuense]